MPFHPHTRAAAGQQYALIVGLVGVVALLSINFLGSGVNTLMSRTSNTLGGVVNGATAGGPGAPPPPPPPTGPNVFTFTDLTAQAQGSLITSNIVQITGMSAGSGSVTLSGGGSPQFRICSNASCTTEVFTWGATSQTINNNQYLQLRLTSATADNTTLSATATINSVSDSWSVSTETALYSFSSHTFTPCTLTGRYGPDLGNCTGHYSTSWDNNTSYFNIVQQGYQVWTVPTSGLYRIEVAGAGNSFGGATVRAEVNLTKSEYLLIAVGQRGINTNDGSGGTFVARGSDYSSATPLIVAGGGCGDYAVSDTAVMRGTYDIDYSMTDSSTPANYSGPTGSNGSGGGARHGGSGGGFYSSGTCNSCGGAQGSGFRQGLVGGYYSSTYTGGFGGGGARHLSADGSGGGGGYSGGRGGYSNSDKCFGGGSYVDAIMTNRANVNQSNTAQGYATITKL